MMHIPLLLFTMFTSVHTTDLNHFIVDYFNLRKVPNVLALTCTTEKDDIDLLKNLNQDGIKVKISKLSEYQDIHRLAFTNNEKIGVLLDSHCYSSENVTSIFTKASEHRIYDDLHYWLVVASDLSEITKLINDSAFGISTDFIVAISVNSTESQRYKLYEVYNIWKERGASLNISIFGWWNGQYNFSLDLSFDIPKYCRRANLLGLTVKVIFWASTNKPHDMKLEDYYKHYTTTPRDGLTKFGYNLLSHLSDLYNFKMKSFEASKWQVGDHLGPIIKSLSSKESDMAGSPLTMNTQRILLVQYVHQSWPFRTCFMFRSLPQKSIKVNEVLGPLEIQVWYLLTLFFFMFVWLMAHLFRFESAISNIESYSNAILLATAALCQQGVKFKMEKLSTRIAFFVFMMSSYLLYNYYSASIVSIRLSEPIWKINDSLNELSKLDLKFSSEFMVYFELFIKKQEWEAQMFYNKVWSKLKEDEYFTEPDKAAELIKKGGYAYHAHPDAIYPYILRLFDNREICQLTEVHLQKPVFSTFAISKNSPFTEMMRVGYTKLSEVGLRRRQIIRWTSDKPKCLQTILYAAPINMDEFAPHLILLLLGMIMAIFIFILEIFIFNRNKILKHKNEKIKLYRK